MPGESMNKKESCENRGASYNTSADKESAKTDAKLPPIDFPTFIFSLSTAAQFQLGEIANPETGKFETELPLAKQTIDILAMLQKKTEGNLTDSESRLLDDILYSLRSSYIDKNKKA